MERTKAMHLGAEWIADMPYGKDMSALGQEVADLLGDLFLGIYHMNSTSLSKVNWSNDHHIVVTVDSTMATYDNDLLTRLVILSHDRMLRIELSGLAPGYTRLIFHKRKKRVGAMHERLPMLEDHIASIRLYYGGRGT